MQQASQLFDTELEVILGCVNWNWITVDPSMSTYQAVISTAFVSKQVLDAQVRRFIFICYQEEK